MLPPCLATIGRRHDFEGELLSAQQADLTIAYQINRRRTNAE